MIPCRSRSSAPASRFIVVLVRASSIGLPTVPVPRAQPAGDSFPSKGSRAGAVQRRGALDCSYELDVLVDERIIVELKAVGRLHSLHTAQLLTYLKLTDCRVGLLINFNVPLLKQGVRRLTHQKNSSALPGSPTPREESDTSWRGD